MIWLSLRHKGGCKKLFIPAVLVSAGFLIAGIVLAYDSHNAHRALTYEAAEFYNLSLPPPLTPPRAGGALLTAQEIGWLMDGAEQEDTPPRWINHFYNPLTGDGWTGGKMGGIPSDTLKLISKLALSSRDPISAKNWAKNRSAQSDYAYYGGDQTWQEAIDAYLQGNKQKAFEALGHILHLLEDMTVPDHTRDDTHAGLAVDKGSPYENWAKTFTAGKEKNLQIASALYKAGQKPKQFPIIENYFDNNANYSSKNFFSEDTINDKNFPIPNTENRINENKLLIVYTVGPNSYPLYVSKDGTETINNASVLSAYWQRLSKQAVISGAGAIDLFFKDVEERKKLNPNPAPRQITSNSKIFSPFGELVKLGKAVNSFVLGAKTIAADIIPSPAAPVDINKLPPPVPVSPPEPIPDPGSVSGMTEKNNPAPTPPPPPQNNPSQPPLTLSGGENTKEKLYISRVVDGDTVILNNGKDVRLIGINTPEVGEKCADEATQELKNLILGKYITLEKDASETDKYGRLLRFIYLDNTLVNAEMVKNGFARIMTVPPDVKYADAFRALEDEAKFFHRGCLYEKSPSSVLPLKKGEEGNDADDRGPYYGGSTWAGNPGGQPVSPSQNNTVGTPPPYSEAASTSTPDASATSTPNIPPIVTPTSTSETATSTPPASATSTPQTAASAPAESDPPAAQDKILISEIQIAGQTADDEFVELYNPNNKPVPLYGWSLQYRGSAASSFSKKNFGRSAAIPSYGFYLIGHKMYSNNLDMDVATSTMSFSGAGGTIFLVRATTTLQTGAEDFISDKAAYLKNEKTSSTMIFPETQEVNIAAGAIFERKSNASSTAETMAAGGINETDGNGYDTDNNQNDFVLKIIAGPQNASSTPEDPTNQHYPPPPKPPEPPPPPPEPIVACATSTYAAHNNNFEYSVPKNKIYDETKASYLPPIYGNPAPPTVLSPNTTYIIDSDIFVKPGAKLVIPEGVVIKFGPWRRNGSFFFPAMLRVAGSLEINGTKNNPVIFTSFRDDARGAPINMTTSTPAPGDWGALQIESDKKETVKIQNAEFYYGGGHQDMANNFGGAIFLNLSDADTDISDIAAARNFSGIYSRSKPNSQPEILNSNFENNEFWGVAAEKNSAIKIVGNTIKCNGVSRGTSAGGGAYIKGGSPDITIENNNFLSNETVGLNYIPDKNENLTAANNYWGHSSGPFHATGNPAGLGNAVSDNVIFSPFSASAYSNSD